MKERKCFVCGTPIVECMGFTMAGDFLRATHGVLPWDEVRERCALCCEKECREETLALLKEFRLQRGP